MTVCLLLIGDEVMTLIIGIKCQNGIIMGADGAATTSQGGLEIIREETTKLEIMDNAFIVGSAGDAGMSQQVKGELQKLWTNPVNTENGPAHFSSLAPYMAARIIHRQLWVNLLHAEMQIAVIAREVLGPKAVERVKAETLLALPLNSGPCLLSFNDQTLPREATTDTPIITWGSGTLIADPFLAFLRRLFWPHGLPTVQEGIFSTLWALDHTIKTHPGGVAEPKQIVILEDANQGQGTPDWKARQLSTVELNGHMDVIRAHEAELIKFHGSLQGGSIPDES